MKLKSTQLNFISALVNLKELKEGILKSALAEWKSMLAANLSYAAVIETKNAKVSIGEAKEIIKTMTLKVSFCWHQTFD